MPIDETDVAPRPLSFVARHPTFARWIVFVALAVLALIIRLPQLGVRPMHTDESVNAYITGELLAGGNFHYDPKDRHGPALFVFAEPLVKLLGANKFSDLTETQLRLTPVLLGSATILLFGACVDIFGFAACLTAALLFAVGPLSVYYSRYFIHETLFVAATLGLMAFGWRAWKRNSLPFAIVAGVCAALMLTSKETAVIHFFALACVVFAGWLANRGAPSSSSAHSEDREKRAERALGAPWKTPLVTVAVFVFTSILLFTWFGHNWSALGDLVRAIPNFTARAGGEGHEKPFGYYFHLLDPLVILSLLAIAGIYAAIFDAVNARKPHWLLGVYGVIVFLIYSAIPYKTPWLALNLWLPFALLCGLGVAAIWEQINKPAGRWGMIIAGAFLLVTLATQTKVWAFDHPADEKNPFAYAHTGEDILRLAPRLEQLATERHLTNPHIAVVAADAWPLPWYLRKFSQVGFWQPGQTPEPADFYITSTDLSEKLSEQLKNFRPEFFGVRPEVLMILWVPVATTP